MKPATRTASAAAKSGIFLAGAASRLLPPSIPFRYFGAAVVYHVAAWFALLAGADSMHDFAGGLSWTLAALHLVTLGVLAMAAIGASLQLLPVATRRAVGDARWTSAVWWLYTPGVALTACGMGSGAPIVVAAGATAVVIALAVYAWLLGRNLVGARGMPVVVAHGWAALGSLLIVIATAVALPATYVGSALLDRSTALALHVAFAAYGFMGMLALGLSYVLVPMFALSAAPDERQGWLSFAAASLALLAAGTAAFGYAPAAMRTLALLAGALAVAVHLRLMTVALKTGMRRNLGRSFTLVRIAWGFLAASVVAALGVVHEAPIDRLATLFGVALVIGWLLTFVLAILQRIVPFLAAMHASQVAARGKTLPPTPSQLTDERALAIHFGCHLAALALLVLAAAIGSAIAVAAAALIGAVGALAFAAFFATALRRMRRPVARAGTTPASAA